MGEFLYLGQKREVQDCMVNLHFITVLSHAVYYQSQQFLKRGKQKPCNLLILGNSN